MDDYISRQAAIEIIASHDETNGTVKVFSGRLVNGLLSTIPAADVVEVVRCKDCKHYEGEGMYCACDIIVHYDHFYCYWGERADK